MKRVLFFFRGARRVREQSGMPFPKDHFYGCLDWPEGVGSEAAYVEQGELPSGPVQAWWLAWLQPVVYALGRIKLDHVLWFGRRKNLEFLNRHDVVVSMTLSQGIALAVLRRLGKLRSRLIYIATALDPEVPHALAWGVLRWVLVGSTVGSLGRGEQRVLEKRLGRPVKYVPFGIDTEYWSPGEDEQRRSYFLSVGDDARRDYEFLVRAWHKDWPELKLLTKRTIRTLLPENVKWIAGGYEGGVSDDELRELYRGAMAVVVPLIESSQPSGQSVALQAMACGTPVVMARTEGFWEPGAFLHGENISYYECGNPEDFASVVNHLVSSADLCEQLGREARQMVEKSFHLRVTAEALESLSNER